MDCHSLSPKAQALLTTYRTSMDLNEVIAAGTDLYALMTGATEVHDPCTCTRFGDRVGDESCPLHGSEPESLTCYDFEVNEFGCFRSNLDTIYRLDELLAACGLSSKETVP